MRVRVVILSKLAVVREGSHRSITRHYRVVRHVLPEHITRVSILATKTSICQSVNPNLMMPFGLFILVIITWLLYSPTEPEIKS